MTYLDKNSTNEAIFQKLSKRDIYEADMHNIYNLIIGQTNEQLGKKAASDFTVQAVNTD